MHRFIQFFYPPVSFSVYYLNFSPQGSMSIIFPPCVHSMSLPGKQVFDVPSALNLEMIGFSFVIYELLNKVRFKILKEVTENEDKYLNKARSYNSGNVVSITKMSMVVPIANLIFGGFFFLTPAACNYKRRASLCVAFFTCHWNIYTQVVFVITLWILLQ